MNDSLIVSIYYDISPLKADIKIFEAIATTLYDLHIHKLQGQATATNADTTNE